MSFNSPPPPPTLTPDDPSAADPARRRLRRNSRWSLRTAFKSSPSKSSPRKASSSKSKSSVKNVGGKENNKGKGKSKNAANAPLTQVDILAQDAVIPTTISLDSNLFAVDDTEDEYQWAVLYENQRGMTIFSIPYYSRLSLLPHDPAPFTIPSSSPSSSSNKTPSRDHAPNVTPSTYPLPDGTWRWVSRSWMIDMRSSDSGEVQHDGFEYNWVFRTKGWTAQVGKVSSGGWVRRRRWVRLMVRPARGKSREQGKDMAKRDSMSMMFGSRRSSLFNGLNGFDGLERITSRTSRNSNNLSNYNSRNSRHSVTSSFFPPSVLTRSSPVPDHGPGYFDPADDLDDVWLGVHEVVGDVGGYEYDYTHTQRVEEIEERYNDAGRIERNEEEGGRHATPDLHLERDEDVEGDVEGNWERCRAVMRRYGRDGRKLEVWGRWLGLEGGQADEAQRPEDAKGKGKGKENAITKQITKQWTEDEGLPSAMTQDSMDSDDEERPAPGPPPIGYVVAVVKRHADDIFRAFVYPDSRAKFIELLARAGVLPELSSSQPQPHPTSHPSNTSHLGPSSQPPTRPTARVGALGWVSSEVDFWSYASGLSGVVGVGELAVNTSVGNTAAADKVDGDQEGNGQERKGEEEEEERSQKDLGEDKPGEKSGE